MNYHIILLKQFKMLKSSDQYFPPDLNPSFFFGIIKKFLRNSYVITFYAPSYLTILKIRKKKQHWPTAL